MIFVTVGTNEARFDRLLRSLDTIPGTEELVVQHGPSSIRPAGATCFESLPFDDFLGYVRQARAVIAHAGVGSVLAILGCGKRPIVVPRLHRHGEAVDDHQRAFANRLGAAGLVQTVDDPAGLAAVLLSPNEHTVELRSDGRLVGELRAYLDERLDASVRDADSPPPARYSR
jgi:UDP-N-acetylglucosamine transferase subunit ALG13